MTPVLEVIDLGVAFGGIRAVDGVSFAAKQNAITTIIGPNGAGKSTLFNLISGLIRPNAGRVVLGGVDRTGSPPHLMQRAGLGRSFQITNLFFELTVFENLRLAAQRLEPRLHFLLPAGKSHRALARVGDLIDRGPQSAQVIERLRTYGRRGIRPVFILGNHEEVLLRILRGEAELITKWRSFGQPAHRQVCADRDRCGGSQRTLSAAPDGATHGTCVKSQRSRASGSPLGPTGGLERGLGAVGRHDGYMRVICASTAGAGHFSPMVPWIEHLIARGNEVLVVGLRET